MPTKKVPPPSEIVAKWGNVPPPPLVAASTENARANAALSLLQRGEGTTDAATLAAAASAGVDAILPLFAGRALEIGKPGPADAPKGKLLPKEKKEYQKLYETCSELRSARLRYIAALAGILAESREGLLRLIEVAGGDHDREVRARAARTLFMNPTGQGERIPEQAVLEALARTLDIRTWDAKDGEDSVIYRHGSHAVFWLDPVRAFDELSPLLDAKAIANPAGVRRAYAVLLGTPNKTMPPTPALDPRWTAALVPALGAKDLKHTARFFLEVLPPEAAVIEPLLADLGETPAKVSYWDETTVRLLGRVADARVLPYLVAALAANWVHYAAAFEGFRRVGDPSVIPAMRAWLDKHASNADDIPNPFIRKEVEARWTLGQTIIAELEGGAGGAMKPVAARSPAPPAVEGKANAKATAKAQPKAPKKSVLVFMKGPKPKAPKVASLAAQRKSIAELFAKADLTKLMDALVAPACLLRPTRVDERTMKIGTTKIGGHPDLPAATAWPRVGKARDAQPLAFLAQVDLAEVSAHLRRGDLPASGLLSFFVGDEPDGDYLETSCVLYTKTRKKLVRHDVPDDFTGEIYQACRVDVVPTLKVAPPDHPGATRKLTKAQRERYAEDVYFTVDEDIQLLGTRDHAYNGSVGNSARLLLQLPSNDQAGMQFGDADTLSIFIDEKRLAKHDFSKVSAQVGD